MVKVDRIVTVCYGKMVHWDNRKKAMDHYAEAVLCSDGCEANRYGSILAQLQQGATLCWDFQEEPKEYEGKFSKIFYGDEE